MNAFTPLPGAAAASAIALYAQPSANFDAKLRETVVTLLKAAATGPVTQASSLGAEDMVITHLINAHALPIEIFVLDTGALHAETLALLEQLKAQQATRPHAPLTVYQPVNEHVVQFVQREGADAMYRSIALRKACCGIRKMEPLARALAGKKAWVTGLRREQSGARADVPLVDRAELESKGLLKYNPLADWSWGDIWHYIASRQVAYNPLHDQFYPSIGCAPCTRAVTLGEDFRAGRWWWESEDLKECGLHVKPHAAAPAAAALRSNAAEVFTSAQAHVAEGGVKDAPASGRSQDEAAKECGLHVRGDTAPHPHPNPLPPAGEGANKAAQQAAQNAAEQAMRGRRGRTRAGHQRRPPSGGKPRQRHRGELIWPAGSAPDPPACPSGGSRSAASRGRRRWSPFRRSSGPSSRSGLPSPAASGCARRP